jgi:Putative addiction module component
MSRTIEEIKSEVLQLDRHARAVLAETLIESLETLTDAEYDELWVEEGEARYADFLAGRTTAIDGDEVFARLLRIGGGRATGVNG